MGLQPLGSLLSDSVRRSGADVERQVDATRICTLWAEAVRLRCSPEILCRSDALSFSSGVLLVGVTGSSVASELQYVQHILVEEINMKLGKIVVKRVQFRVVGDVDPEGRRL